MRLLIVFALGALFGGGIGFLFWQDAADAAVEAERLSRSRQEVVSPEPRGAHRAGEGARELTTASEARRAVARLLDAAAPHLPGGEAVLEGLVHDATGRPVEGVRLVATPVTPQATIPPGEDLDSVDRVLAFARFEAAQGRSGRETTSDAAGRFRFSGLPDGPHRLTAEKELWEFRGHWPHDALLAPQSPGREIRLEGKQLGFIPLRFLWPSGEEAEDVAVSVEGLELGSSYENSVRWTRARGGLEVPPGRYRIFPGERGRAGFPPFEARTRAARDAPPIEVVLEARGALRGRVLRPDFMERYPRLIVRARPDPERKLRAEDLRGAERIGRPEARNRFRFELSGLEPGPWALCVHDSWRRVNGPLLRIDVKAGTQDLEIPAPVPPEADRRLVRFRGPERHPLPGVRIEVVVSTEAGDGVRLSRSVAWPAAELGSYWFVLPGGWSELKAPRGFLTATHERFGRRGFPFDPRDRAPLELHFDAAASVEVALPEAALRAVEGQVRLALFAVARRGPSHDEAVVPGERPVRFGPLPPGTYRLCLEVRHRAAAGGPTIFWRRELERLDLPPGGALELHPRLPETGRLEVRCSRDRQGKQVTLAPAEENGLLAHDLRARVDGEGLATFASIPQGRYVLTGSWADAGEEEVVVARSTAVSF